MEHIGLKTRLLGSRPPINLVSRRGIVQSFRDMSPLDASVFLKSIYKRKDLYKARYLLEEFLEIF